MLCDKMPEPLISDLLMRPQRLVYIAPSTKPALQMAAATQRYAASR